MMMLLENCGVSLPLLPFSLRLSEVTDILTLP